MQNNSQGILPTIWPVSAINIDGEYSAESSASGSTSAAEMAEVVARVAKFASLALRCSVAVVKRYIRSGLVTKDTEMSVFCDHEHSFLISSQMVVSLLSRR